MEKDQLINQLNLPNSDDLSELSSQNRKLKRDSQMYQLRSSKLSQELANKQLNGKFVDLKKYEGLIEEVEDLRINYKESVKLNLVYEEQLKIKSLE
jgi:hypothetical protein